MSARLAASLVLFSLLARAADAQQAGINWVNSVSEARGIAQQRQQLVLMHFYSDDCMPCKLLESRVFPQAAVAGAVNRGYVPVKINTSVQREVARLYNVYTWPTDIITDPRGRELYRTVSPQDANRYIQMLSSTMSSYHATMPYSQQVDGQGLAAAGGEAAAQLAGNLAQTPMATGEQYAQQYAAQAQQYTQSVEQAAQQAQQAGQDQVAGAQQYAQQAQNGVQQYAQQAQAGVQQYAQQAQDGVQQYAQQAQNGVQQYAQQTQSTLDQYQQQAQQGLQQYATQFSQQAQQYAQQGQSYAPQPGREMEAATRNLGVAGAPFAAANPNGYSAGPNGQGVAQPAPTGQAPAGSVVARAPAEGQAPPYGQMTHNPYFNSQPTAPTGSTASNPPPVAPYQPQTTPYSANPGQQLAQGPSATGVPAIPPTPPYQPAQAAGAKPLGMDGFCPVTLMTQKKWAKGDIRFGAIHRGRTYQFVSQKEQEMFLADPDRYSPMLSGYDPVVYQQSGQLVAGKRAHGVTYMNHMFLFQDEPSLQKFCESREFYLNEVRQAMMRAGTTVVR